MSMTINPVQLIEGSRFMGPLFGDLKTWATWLVFVKCTYGLALDEMELAAFQKHTGRQAPREGGYPEAVAIVGVQSGKSRIAAALAAHAAVTGQSGTTALMVAQDHRGAMRTLLKYAREPFETITAFEAEVTRSTADTLELESGVTLSAYPCRPESVRGLRACIAIVDELAFFQTSDGRPTDVEMLRAVRGRVATTQGKVIILSSPYTQSGALWDLHKKHYSVEASSTLVWVATAPEMNHTLSPDYLQKMKEDDPEAYRSEVLGEFRAGVSTFFDPEALGDCVADGGREQMPQDGTRYFAFCDAASGSGKDSFAVAIAHSDGSRSILDCMRVWAPPFDPSVVIAEAAALAKKYRLNEVSGDAYAPGFLLDGFRRCGISYKFSKLNRSEIYLELLPLINSGQAVLLDDEALMRELRGLERKRGTAGHDRVDHRSGQHDDRANAAAGALLLAIEPTRSGSRVMSWPGCEPEEGWWGTLQFRHGKPWAGICPPDPDYLGRPTTGKSAVFENGRIVRYID